MKTPTADPNARKSGHDHDISTWISVAFAILALVKIGIIVSRHL